MDDLGIPPQKINLNAIMSEFQSPLPVDLDRLNDITNGDAAIIQELADDYFLQATEIAREIDRAIPSRSIDQIQRLTHKLRGSSATLGVTAIRAPIGKIEQSIRESDFDSANQALRDVFQTLEEARIFIKTYLT